MEMSNIQNYFKSSSADTDLINILSIFSEAPIKVIIKYFLAFSQEESTNFPYLEVVEYQSSLLSRT